MGLFVDAARCMPRPSHELVSEFCSPESALRGGPLLPCFGNDLERP